MRTIILVAGCITVAFFLGVQSANEVETVPQTQASQTVSVIFTLQVDPVLAGATVRPFVFNNTTSTKPIKLLNILDASVIPVTASEGCQRTTEAGRCSITGVPVGNYDVVFAPGSFFETITGIPLEEPLPVVRFDPAACTGTSNSFDMDAQGSKFTWCMRKKSDGTFYTEYFIKLTFKERDTCLSTPAPAAFCSTGGGGLVQYRCNPSTTAPTRPWEELPPQPCTQRVTCPDGNSMLTVCSDVEGTAICSSAEACRGHQLCSVTGFPSHLIFRAGKDTVIITGKEFGLQGGTITMPVESGGGGGRSAGGATTQEVDIPIGPDWLATQIRVAIPANVIEGPWKVHPRGFGFIEERGTTVPVACETPLVRVLSARDQFSIVSVWLSSPKQAPVTPGFLTTLSLLTRRPEGVGVLKSIEIELLEGSFPTLAQLPLQRPLLASVSCFPRITDGKVSEAIFTCDFPIPASLVSPGPFTFYVRLMYFRVIDGDVVMEETLLPVSGTVALAGDFDESGLLSIKDAVIAQRIATGRQSATARDLLHDVDDDNAITTADATAILHFLTRPQ